MPRNVEIKARLADLASARAIAAGLGARFEWDDEQIDRYYELDGGRRLKLRTARGSAELIRYDRPETAGVRVSAYEISPVRDDAAACLVPTTRPVATVRKRRELWRLGNVRIHLDSVATLGLFVEFEAVVDAAHDEAYCRAEVDRLLVAFGIAETDCLRASYGELVAG
ncbi:MAG: class IV adenylate cyclase [Candidatus Binatia bacterium]